MKIVDQKSDQRTDQRPRDQRQRNVEEAERHEGEKCRDHEGHASRQTVDTVGQVDAVDNSHNQKQRKNIIDDPQLHRTVGKGDVKLGVDITEKFQKQDVSRRRHDLKQEFLVRFQPLILLFHQLAVIVHKADHTVHHGKCHGKRQRDQLALPVVHGVINRHAGEHQHDRHDKADAAHGRRSLLGAVPRRSLRADRLTDLFAPQNRDNKVGKYRRKKKRRYSRNQKFPKKLC